MAADHQEIGIAAQLSNDVVGDAFGEVVLLGIAAQIVERQHGDRRPVGGRCDDRLGGGTCAPGRCPHAIRKRVFTGSKCLKS